MSSTEVTGFDLLSAELFRLTRLFDRAGARYTARRADGVERAAYLLLARLVSDGPRRLSVLADSVHSDTSTVSRQVAELVKLGLVERRPDHSDGRASLLAATEAGNRSYQARREARNAGYAALLADWSAEDQLRLRELLARFNNDFERYYLGGDPR
ncbi:MAG TPA: MarR family transcriptional regulator [Pseudonocardia sp.]